MCTVAPPLAASIAAFEQMTGEQQVLALELLSRLVQSGQARPARRYHRSRMCALRRHLAQALLDISHQTIPPQCHSAPAPGALAEHL